VCDAKSNGFALTWSAWVARGPEIPTLPGVEVGS
jgi:hypothetical protein